MDKAKLKLKKLLSAFMAIITICGVFGSVSILPVYAADGDEPKEIIDYLTKVFNTPEDKLETMELRTEAFGYELYYEDYSGEVALRNKVTGQVMFTNPYTVGAQTVGSADTKALLMSQLVIRYTDNDQDKTYPSFTEAAKRGQIYAKNIKNGLRVEYTIGKEETRSLVPKRMEATRFNSVILDFIEDETALKKMNAFYTLKDPDDPKLTVRGVKELQATFEITKKMAVYVFDPYASAREINLIESYIKRFCPHYTFADLDGDHAMTEFEDNQRAPALFKMSLEYYLNEDGLEIRMPANGIRFDESTYQLNYIQILPYMGAGNNANEGYTFLPDGSGTIMRFEDFVGQNLTVSGKLYGQDFAFHEIKGAHQQVMRLPVYGIVEHVESEYEYEVEIEEVKVDENDPEAEPVITIKTEKRKAQIDEMRGFLAIVTEGDALADVTTLHGGALHKYCTVYTQFYPRPKDAYNIGEAISVGANAMWTVVSKRKYAGSYRIQYIMLTDADIARQKGIRDYYETEWTGMAKAYRDYLVKTGVLSLIDDAKPDIPLYIESFGAIQVMEQILSIPVEVKKPLTTFDDVKIMYEKLSSDQVSNVVFKLTGFYNGGFATSPPTSIKFVKEIGGDKGYKDLLEYAKAKGIDVYPEVDFIYINRRNEPAFSGYKRSYQVKTIDNRYANHRRYDPVYQMYWRGSWLNITSASVYNEVYAKFTKAIDKLGVNGIAASTLGSDLNSDFNKKEPYNREDSKQFTIKLLEEMYEDYGKIMLSAGNAYTFKYASAILDVPLDSSRYFYSSQAVPFMGMVLHGYIPFAGTPTNMTGDINYETLKIIENGSFPYFILSYQNTSKLKESFNTSQYYSVSFEIWYDDLVAKYKELNGILASLQKVPIDGHKFIEDAERIASAEEIAADKAADAKKAAEEAETLALKEEKDTRAANLKARKAEEAYQEAVAKAIEAGEEVPERPTQSASTGTTTSTTDKDDDAKNDDEKKDEKPVGYVKNKYTCALGTVVKVTYANGTSFILNYNSFQIRAEGKTIEPLSYIKIG